MIQTQSIDVFALLHTAADVVGSIASLPLIYGIIRIVKFTSQVEEHTETVTQMLSDHEDRLRGVEPKISILWDKHENAAQGMYHPNTSPSLGAK